MIQKLWQAILGFTQKNNSTVVVDEAIVDKNISFEKLFQNSNPVVIEFGMGKGRFMRDYALTTPQKNFFGVEKINKWVKHSAVRLEKAKLANVRIVETDVNKVLAKTPPKSVHEYYILFPDPWPKRRHQQRRIIQTKLVDQIHSTLVNHGRLYIATDHAQYFDHMKKVIHPFLEKHFTSIDDKIEFISNYQVKYEREGRPIYSIHLQKR